MHEYRSDFLYFVLRPGRLGAFTCCSGVNLTRFSPIIKGRHGIGSNPAVRGLQLVNLGLRDFARSRGAVAKKVGGNDCIGMTPAYDTWYTEILLIENAPESFPAEMITYCVMNLLKKIFNACMLDVVLPDELPGPDELRVFLEGQCGIYGGA